MKSRAQSKHQHVDSTDRFNRTKEYKGSVSSGSRARITAEELERWASTDCAVAGRPYPVREKGRAAARKPGSADGADCALAPPGAAEPDPASLPAAQELPSRTYRGALQLRPALLLPSGAAGRSRRNPAPPSPPPVSASPRGTGTPLPPPPLSQRARWNARVRGWSCSWQTRARTWKRAERRPLQRRRRRRRRRSRWFPRPAGTTRMISCVSTRVRDANIVWPWLPGCVPVRG